MRQAHVIVDRDTSLATVFEVWFSGYEDNRIAVSGGSAGGYLALVSGYIFEPRPKAIISHFGYGDPTKDWESKP